MKNLMYIVLALTTMLVCGGCSVVGFAVGSAIDGSGPRYSKDNKWSSVVQKSGQSMILVSAESKAEITGSFLKLDTLTDDAYQASWTKYRDRYSSVAWLPQPGDSVMLRLNNSQLVHGRFDGFDFSVYDVQACLKQHHPNPGRDATGCRLMSKGICLFVPFTRIHSVEALSGESCPASALQALAGRGCLPWRHQIRFLVADSIRYVDINDVAVSRALRKDTMKWMLGGIGLAVDIAVIIIAASKFPDLGSGSGSWGR